MKKTIILLMCAVFSSFSMAKGDLLRDQDLIGISKEGIIYCDFETYQQTDLGQLRVKSMPVYGVWPTTSPLFVFNQYLDCKKDGDKWLFFDSKGQILKQDLSKEIFIPEK